MIITQIIGGLGNQMFQYAMARALSLERQTPLLLDISHFDTYRRHQGFELKRIFNCSSQIATKNDVRTVLGWQSTPAFKKIFSRPFMSAFRREEFVLEPHYHFWREVGTTPSVCYLQGYWQSQRYFEKYLTVIRDDFKFKLPLNDKNIQVADRITQVNAVSLHVRRGDYVSNKKTTDFHGLCSIEYYCDAIKNISSKIINPVFFIFSDDIAWAKENVPIEFPRHYVEHNQGIESFNDMHLMSLCCHNIIANSSFSWWGAWLNSNQNKIVIAPKKWFANSINTKDLLPDGWISL